MFSAMIKIKPNEMIIFLRSMVRWILSWFDVIKYNIVINAYMCLNMSVLHPGREVERQL